MKKLIKIAFYLIALVLGQMVTSQTVTKSSIDNGGASVSNANIQMVYTIGEVNVQEVWEGNLHVSEGFIGPSYTSNTVYIPDDNFEQALIDKGIDDVLDGYVLTASVKDLLTLDVNGTDKEESKKIVDLTGIEGFTSLTILNCNDNNLSRLDLSSNLALTSLRSKSNKLTYLNIRENKLLSAMTCSRNQLTDLDLSQNTELTDVWCFSNLLTNLDVSNNAKLLKLHSFSNPNLSCIEVSEEQINDIPDAWKKDEGTEYSTDCDGAALTFIPDNNFEQALIDKGIDDVLDGYVLTASVKDLLTLDVNGTDKEESKKIVDLTGIEDFTSLTILNCNDNNLSRLDLSSNLALTSLRSKSNKLTYLNIRENKLLSAMTCSRNQLTDLDLSQNTELTDVWCFSNLLTNLDVSNNAKLLKLHSFSNPNLSCIEVSEEQINDLPDAWKKDEGAEYSTNCDGAALTFIPDNNFEQALIDKGIDDVLDGYVLTASVKDLLTLDVNGTDKEESKKIVDLTGIEDFTSLTILNCNDNNLSRLDLSSNLALTSLRSKSNKLTYLNIRENKLLSAMTCSRNQLTDLDLSQNTELTDVWCFSNLLTNLDVSNNAKLLKLHSFSNPNLSCIEVSEEQINDIPDAWKKDEGAEYSTNCDGVALTFIPDNNFEQALIDKGIDDVLDGYVLTESINNLLELDVNGENKEESKKIVDLTGIEDFVSLTMLICNSNKLSSLDLSSNIALTDLQCKENELTSLNITENKLLNLLTCSRNQLASLDLSENTELIKVWCFDNQLESLDVSKNVKLIKLHSFSNQLTNLDVSQNVQLIDLRCHYNQLQNIDVSKNLRLETLNCRNNQIQNLDLSKNSKLEFLNCKRNELVSLNINNGTNALVTDFHATGNTSLQCIVVDDATKANAGIAPYDTWLKDETTGYCENELRTYVPDDGFEQELIDLGYDDVLDDYVITRNINKVITLSLKYYEITDLTGIEDFRALEFLNISSEMLSVKILDLSENINLTRLRFWGFNHIDYLNITKNVKLTGVTIYETTVGNIDFTKNIALENLYLDSSQDITDLDLTQNIALKSLYLENMIIDTNLDLSKNIALESIGIVHCVYLPSLDLSYNKNLKSVYIETNRTISQINLKNGNNTAISNPSFLSNNNLKCIQVDNAAWSYDNWEIEAISITPAIFSENCSTNAQAKTASDNGKEVLTDPIVIYPNPATSLLNIDSGSLSLIKIEIYSSLGQKVNEISTDLNTIEIGDLSSGVYLIRLYTANGVSVRKIIKK